MSTTAKIFIIFTALLFTATPLAIIYPLVLLIRYVLKQSRQGSYSNIDYSRINFIAPGLIPSNMFRDTTIDYPKRDPQWYREEQDIQTKINQIKYSQTETQKTSLNPAEQTTWNQIIQNLKDN
jgi:hypothetical protein